MAREHKMVGTESSIPEGILVGDEGDVVSEDTSHGLAVAGNVTYDSDDTEGHEKNKCLVGVPGAIQGPLLHLINKSAFCPVYAS